MRTLIASVTLAIGATVAAAAPALADTGTSNQSQCSSSYSVNVLTCTNLDVLDRLGSGFTLLHLGG